MEGSVAPAVRGVNLGSGRGPRPFAAVDLTLDRGLLVQAASATPMSRRILLRLIASIYPS